MNPPLPHEQPSPEKGPAGIVFNIQNEALIFQATEEGQSGEIANALMPSPIEEMRLELMSNATTFDLEASVSYSDEATYSRYFKANAVIQRVTSSMAHNGEVIERGGHYVLNGSRGTQFVIGLDEKISHINLTTGKTKNLMRRPFQIVPSPEVESDAFSNALADAIEVLQVITEASYMTLDKRVPNQEILIHPPMRPIKRLGNFAIEGTTGNGLLDKIDIERPQVTFEEIGGQSKAKEEVEGLSFALSHPDLYKKWGTKPPKGILLYGPPGTGKTLMAKALASQANARFLHVNASDIGAKWYGESEKIVQQIFDYANSGEGNTIIYFDEIDSIVPIREGQHAATQRVIGVLLQNIDGMESKDNVMIVASTNRMQSVDSAMLRPGRLDRLVELGLPDAAGRESIFGIHINKAQKIAGDTRELFNGIDANIIAKRTDGYSGADIAEIIRRALEKKVRLEGRGQDPGQVTTHDFLEQVDSYERRRQDRWQTDFPGQYL